MDVILNPKFKETMDQISSGTKNTVRHKGFFAHIMLDGPPGTGKYFLGISKLLGKTMWAQKLARESKIDFALVSGPSCMTV